MISVYSWVASKERGALALTLLLALSAFPVRGLIAKDTPLLSALKSRQEKRAIALIQKGSGLFSVDAEGRSPVWIASFRGYPKAVSLLLGAAKKSHRLHKEANRQDKTGASPLLVAAQQGHIEIMQILLRNGADVNLRDKSGRSALSQAMLPEDQKIPLLLLAHGARADIVLKNGWTPLLLAAKFGREKTILPLLKAGADLDGEVNPYAENAMEVAIRNGRLPFIKALLANDWSIDQKNPLRKGRTPLMTAAEFGNFRAVVFLIKKGAKLELRDVLGNTALHLAVLAGSYEATKALLAAGANPNAQNSLKERPIDIALLPENAATHSSIIKLLKKYGAKN